MRKVAAVVALVFALAVGLGTGRTWAGNVTFNITNSAPSIIYLKFFSRSRPWAWPSASEHYNLDDGLEHSFTLTCNNGEQVCFGGGYSQDGSGRYWGVGFLNDHGCTNCCLICGPDNPTHGWNLVE